MNRIKEFIKNISPFNNRSDMPKALYVIKVILIFLTFKFASELIGEALVIGLHFACGKNPLEGELFGNTTITLITCFGYGFMAGLVFLFWKLFQKKSLAELGLTKKFGSYFAGGLLAIVLVSASAGFIVLSGAIRFNGIFDSIDRLMVFLMLGGFIFQGAFEELLCRGIVQQLLEKKTSFPLAYIVSAVLFTLPHFSPSMTAAGIVNLFLISLIFSLLTKHYKSIWAACGLHSVWNFILYSVLGLNLSGQDEIATAVFDMSSVGDNLLNGGVYGIEASVICTAVLTVGAAILLLREFNLSAVSARRSNPV